jgi:hypothetical protein
MGRSAVRSAGSGRGSPAASVTGIAKLGRDIAAGTLPIVATSGAVPLTAASVFALLPRAARCEALTESAADNPVVTVAELPDCVLPCGEESAAPLARIEVAVETSRAASASDGLEEL